MKRNKRSEKVWHQDLTPLTERILAKMGPEGAEIRRRLQSFYQNHTDPGAPLSYAQGRLKRPEK